MDARVRSLAADLQQVFGARLQSLVAYGDPDSDPEGTPTLALVERLAFDDLARCAPLVAGWRKAGLAVPLVLTREEFRRSLDVFPVEYGSIMARHVVVLGDNPFAGMEVHDADLRRACELQAKSHLIHLREGYLESGGQPAAVARLVAASSRSLQALIENLERLDAGAPARAGISEDLLREVSSAEASTIADPSALFARYLAAVELLWHQVDGWRA
jgi:hypothetical protein